MKKTLIIFTVFIMFVALTNLYSGDVTFVGSGKCKMCHKSEKQGQQYPLWESRKHSKSSHALTTDKAKEMCPDPLKNEKCLGCHMPLAGKADEFKEEGVSCEVCHGPGSDYKKMSVMKDHTKAVAAGMTDYADEAAIKKQCLSCHENAHDKTFDFAAAWVKVQHKRPDK